MVYVNAFDRLIMELREKNLNTEADALMAEVTKEWESSTSTVTKRAKRLLAQAYLAKTVDALRTGKPASVTPTGYKFELARGVADALKSNQSQDAIVPTLEPLPRDEDNLSEALRGGTWVVLGFEDGKFSAAAEEMVGEGETWEVALQALADKLSDRKDDAAPTMPLEVDETGENDVEIVEPTPTEYGFYRKRRR